MTTYLITGANRGIGAEMRAQALAAGHRVIATTRGALPEGDDWHRVDVTDANALIAMADSLGQTPIDVLVCNAGVYKDKGFSLQDYDVAAFTDSFAVNVTGVFLTVRAFLPALMRADRPRIAVISSQMGSSERAPGGSYAYRASKSAATNLARNLASDLGGQGVAVGAYHPGWVQTDMGGAAAQITPAQSAAGLLARFEDLKLENTGVFKTYAGDDYPF